MPYVCALYHLLDISFHFSLTSIINVSRYELDMLLSKLASTARKVDSLLEKFRTDKIGPETTFVVEDHFTG